MIRTFTSNIKSHFAYNSESPNYNHSNKFLHERILFKIDTTVALVLRLSLEWDIDYTLPLSLITSMSFAASEHNFLHPPLVLIQPQRKY